MKMQLTECICRDAQKKYRCETCGVYRDDLFDTEWKRLDDLQDVQVDAIQRLLDESMAVVIDCDHYNYAKKYEDENVTYWYCTNCGNAANTITELHEKGAAVSNKKHKKRRNKRNKALEAARAVKHDEVFETPDGWYRCTGWMNSAERDKCLIKFVPLANETNAAAETNHLWDQEFVKACVEVGAWINHGKLPIRFGQKFKTVGVTKVKECKGWDENGVMLYADDVSSGKISKIMSWKVPYIAERFDKGGWELVGSPNTKSRMCNLCEKNRPKKKEKTCGACKDRKSCARCYVKFDDPAFATKCKHTIKEQYTSKPYSGKGGGAVYSKCRHYHLPVTLPGGFIVHASSMNNKRQAGDGLPDWGLYADWGWKPYWRAEHIDWPDFGIPFDDTIALDQILVAVERVQNGDDVEIGCIGGHGRTGTIIAAMRVILGEDADTAIKTVRKEYCSHAIETSEQEWWVEWVESAVRGTPLSEKPAYSYADFGYGSSKTYHVGANHAKNKAAQTEHWSNDWENGGHCSQSAHFYMWLKGRETCTTTNACKFWDSDTTSFERSKKSGDWPKNMMKDQKGEVQPYTWHLARAKTGAFHPNDPREKKPKSTTPPGLKPVSKAKKNIRYEVRVPSDDGMEMLTVPVHAPPRSPRAGIGGDIQHTPLRKNGCLCDVCRYVNSGHGAFIMPGDLANAAIWTKEMDALEEKADEAIKLREHMNEGRHVTILLADGQFVESRVSDEWDPEPEGEGRHPFQIKGDKWQWIAEEGKWVWLEALTDEDFALRANLAVMNANTLPLGD
jgi:hypothetical protein